MVDINASTTALATMPSNMGWTITVLVFFGILAMIFLLSTNFRRFMYGAIISSVLWGIFLFSRYVGMETQQGNKVPLTWFMNVVLFVGVSVIVGYFISKLPFIKRWEKSMQEQPKEASEPRDWSK